MNQIQIRITPYMNMHTFYPPNSSLSNIIYIFFMSFYVIGISATKNNNDKDVIL